MKHLGTTKLETSRLILRPFVKEDAEAMFRNWASDPEVTKYLTWPCYKGVDTAHAILADWTEKYQDKAWYQWAIELKEIGEPIGSISVVEYKEHVQSAEIGYCIGKPWWGNGIMTEALKAVMDFLFREVGILRIEAGHDVANPASGAVMAKCGMIREGILRHAGKNNQGICDMCICAILREEWEK